MLIIQNGQPVEYILYYLLQTVIELESRVNVLEQERLSKIKVDFHGTPQGYLIITKEIT